ncbi:RecQ helicase TLH3 [Metarhizium guizhouense ARSEF 977]|uniref:RecQ helicase TLH3 n=1 Tax=Metarhizium guizhouense (strain ARSEF 977) TaxID=1276136 RepID=A0A0B4G2R9_METGA|nr:RecQ helicase TLH3 [Metarhizium guizhouense ARSEF 977]
MARRSSGYWLRDHIQDDILFQSWLLGDILAAWRVSASAVEEPTLALLAVKDAELDRQAEAICAAELQRLTSASLSSPLQPSARPSARTAREPLSPILVSNWMRQTGWEALFANANRRLLIAIRCHASSSILVIPYRFAWVPSSFTNIPTRSFHLA